MAMPLAQDARQVLVHPLALVDAIERGQRGGVLVVLVEHRQERLLGALQIAEVGLEAGGQAQQHVAPDGRRTIRRRRLGHGGDEGVPLVRGARQPQELVERLLRRRILLDGLGPPAEGGDLIDQLVLGDLGQAAQERLPLAEVGDPTELHLVDLVQLLPLLAGAVERLEHLGDLDLHRAAHEHPLERGARLGVRRVGDQDLAVGLDRLRQVHQRQLVDLRQPEGAARRPLVVGGGDADLAAHDLRQLVPLLGAAVETIERDQRRPCSRRSASTAWR